jgi:hypothetical protein
MSGFTCGLSLSGPETRQVADAYFTIGTNHIRQSPLPQSVRNTSTGVIYTRPRRWY